ncbi:MAG: hypothetical protein EZS28_036443 [Streblomastix strix]|uniref:Uncharacterized protein n=1 Tax=Streblomastix strix TaxID=222440 RepID=A0A5J4UCU7_9EUKA|nr:MAG: hypothetical protein EZS28_036443 [Streblomastix strix]
MHQTKGIEVQAQLNAKDNVSGVGSNPSVFQISVLAGFMFSSIFELKKLFILILVEVKRKKEELMKVGVIYSMQCVTDRMEENEELRKTSLEHIMENYYSEEVIQHFHINSEMLVQIMALIKEDASFLAKGSLQLIFHEFHQVSEEDFYSMEKIRSQLMYLS